MPCSLSRREVLRFLAIVLPAAAVGWKRSDYFDRELVCVHVYDPAQQLPAPLLRPTSTPGRRPAERTLFHVGLPELILCRTQISLLHLYPFFWPVTRSEVRQLQESTEVLFQIQQIVQKKGLCELQEKLSAQRNAGEDKKSSLAVIFTLNDATRNASAAIVETCRNYGVVDLVIFKDPSRPPYLCSFASRQKGFKRPPPIG